jgi:peptidyl-prolyl cis-trans isomerase A (cyclophilin A)
MDTSSKFFLSSFGLAAAVAIASCSSSNTTNTGVADAGPGDPPAEGGTDSSPPVDAGPSPLAACTRDPGATPPTFDANSASDPTGGAAAFTLAKALEGFPSGSGKLTAGITTEKGFIKCELLEAVAPVSVANFVGLARGTRPYKLDGKWKVGRFYDGLIWHRVIPNFVIQGGDPDGVGTGGPGYDLIKENQVAEPLGTLAMAASAQVSGSQFYVVVGTGPAANYNVFGTCSTETAVAIAAVPVDGDDNPKTPVHMNVEIARCP